MAMGRRDHRIHDCSTSAAHVGWNCPPPPWGPSIIVAAGAEEIEQGVRHVGPRVPRRRASPPQGKRIHGVDLSRLRFLPGIRGSVLRGSGRKDGGVGGVIDACDCFPAAARPTGGAPSVTLRPPARATRRYTPRPVLWHRSSPQPKQLTRLARLEKHEEKCYECGGNPAFTRVCRCRELVPVRACNHVDIGIPREVSGEPCSVARSGRGREGAVHINDAARGWSVTLSPIVFVLDMCSVDGPWVPDTYKSCRPSLHGGIRRRRFRECPGSMHRGMTAFGPLWEASFFSTPLWRGWDRALEPWGQRERLI